MAEHCYAESRFMLSLILSVKNKSRVLNVVMLSVVMLSVVAPFRGAQI
jgi:hypothetical protein